MGIPVTIHLVVRGYHIIFTAYGFWLPNDPRGSWSDFIGAWHLLRYGRATKVRTPRSLAAEPHDRTLRLDAKRALKYPAVRFTGTQARAIARGFADFSSRNRLTVWACAILHDHVHMVYARHRYRAEQVVTHLKGAATRSVNAEGIHPLAGFAAPGHPAPKMWARGVWKVFLDDVPAIRRAVQYVQENPAKEGLRRQRWRFVHPIDEVG